MMGVGPDEQPRLVGNVPNLWALPILKHKANLIVDGEAQEVEGKSISGWSLGT
jgi:hypothetical protein